MSCDETKNYKIKHKTNQKNATKLQKGEKNKCNQNIKKCTKTYNKNKTKNIYIR